jgi:putative Mn2+ efflux pump MntP
MLITAVVQNIVKSFASILPQEYLFLYQSYFSFIILFGLPYIYISVSFQDDVTKFNSQLDDLFLLKLKVEAAIGQETLKIERYKYMVHKQLCLNQHEKKLK